MTGEDRRGVVAKVIAFFRELSVFVGQGWRNFRSYDAPLHRRVALTFRNLWRRVQLQEPCCGNFGEPGC